MAKGSITSPYKVTVQRNTQKLKLEKIRFRYLKNVNIYIGEANRIPTHAKTAFFKENAQTDDGSITLHYKGDPWLSSVLRDIGTFESVSEAKGAGWHKKADRGFFTKVLTVKKRPCRLTIWKDVEEKKEDVVNYVDK